MRSRVEAFASGSAIVSIVSSDAIELFTSVNVAASEDDLKRLRRQVDDALAEIKAWKKMRK